MSYALNVHRLPEDMLQRFPGCRDDRLLRQCLKSARARLEELDEEMYDEDEEDDIRHEQAFRELFSGDITAGHCGARYGWAFDALCACIGEPLSNVGFSPCDIDWYEQLDAIIEKSGLTSLRLMHLISACPIPIPLSDDWPMIGHWTYQAMTESAGAFRSLADRTHDNEIREAWETADDWLRSCPPDHCLVAFHG